MKFSYSHMFYLIFVIFLLGCTIIYGIKKRKKILLKFALKNVFNSIIPDYSVKRRYIKGGLLIISLLFIVIALAGPLVGFRWEKIEEKGVDIMICLDCSRSMLASDIKPDRLARAKHEIIDLLRMMKSDRTGLVAFSGIAVLQCPLTMDYGAFNIFLNALTPDYFPVGGTNISKAIETALKGFDKNIDSDKAIILITDGENTAGHEFEAAEKAAKQGVKIFCIGVGSLDGAPVPDKNGGFKKDSSGRIIMSKVDDTILKKISEIANGRYVRSVAGNMDLDLIYNQDICKNMNKKTIKSTRRKIWDNRFQWFLFPGIFLLFVELFIDEKQKKFFFIVFLFVLPMIFFSFPSSCRAGACSSVKKGIKAFSRGEYARAEKNFIDAQLDRPDLPELYYDIGTAEYKKGDFKKALRNFKKALDTNKTNHKNLRAKALYNLANTEYRLGNLEKAVKDYEKVLQENPKNKNAKENLEFVKKKLKEKQKNDKNNKKKKSDKNKKNDKNKEKNQSNKNQKNKHQQYQKKNNENQNNKNIKNQNNKKNNKNSNKKKNIPKNNEKKKDKNKSPKNIKNTPMNRNKKNKGKQNKNNSAPLDKMQEMMLNRLKDKPGQAMMPEYGKKIIEKDW